MDNKIFLRNQENILTQKINIPVQQYKLVSAHPPTQKNIYLCKKEIMKNICFSIFFYHKLSIQQKRNNELVYDEEKYKIGQKKGKAEVERRERHPQIHRSTDVAPRSVEPCEDRTSCSNQG